MEAGPYVDLYVFNSTTTRLLELVNTFLNDPYDDSENLKALQPFINKLLETSEEIIRRKANRAIAEMIVQNFGASSDGPPVFAQELPSLDVTSSNKRKMSESEVEMPIDQKSVAVDSSSSSSAPTIPPIETSPVDLLLTNPQIPIPAGKFLPSGWVVETPRETDWTDFDIRRLRSVVSQFGESWYDVAVYMNCGLTAKQCCDKWEEIKEDPEVGRLPGEDESPYVSNNTSPTAAAAAAPTTTTAAVPHLPVRNRNRTAANNSSPSLVGLPYKTPPQYREWLQYEVIYLKELVVKFKQGAKGRRFINWSLVGQALNRCETDCKERWAHMVLTKVKKGPYKPEEDERIIRLVKECLEGGAECVSNEVWEQLERELGRPAKNVRLRWRISLSRKSVSGGIAGGFYFNGSSVRVADPTLGSKNGGKGGESEDDEEDLENVTDSPAVSTATTRSSTSGKRTTAAATTTGCVSSDDIVSTGSSGHQEPFTLYPQTNPGILPVPSSAPAPHLYQQSNYDWVSNIPNEDGWTNLNIRRLRSVVSQLGDNWQNVAVYMNCGVTAKECSDKWHEIKDIPDLGTPNDSEPAQTLISVSSKGYKEWCTYEVIYLKELVLKHQVRYQGRMVTNWPLVSQALNRPEMDCRERWQFICSSRVKKGPYKQEEDEHILIRIRQHYESRGIDPNTMEYSDCVSSDMWEVLERELGRPAKNIRLRWRASLTRKSELNSGGGAGDGSSSSSSGGANNLNNQVINNSNNSTAYDDVEEGADGVEDDEENEEATAATEKKK